MRSGSSSGGAVRRSRAVAAAAVTAFAVCLAWTRVAEAQIPWTEDLARAKSAAAEGDAVLLLHFYTDSCVPCRMLESRAFRDPQLVDAMKRSVVPCKINADKHRDVAAHYGVTRWPTDVYLAPDGTELGRGVSPQQVPDYLKVLDRIAGLNHTHRQLRASAVQVATAPAASANPYANDSSSNRLPPALTRQTQPKTIQNLYAQQPAQAAPVVTHAKPVAASTAFRSAAAAAPVSFRNDHLAADAGTAQPAAPRPQPSTAAAVAAQPSVEPPAAPGNIAVPATDDPAMSGYCPVTLAERWDWVGGQSQFAVRHRGRVYHMIDADAVKKFMQFPDRYAPMFSGYDLVHFLKTGRLIDGSREFGCQYQGRIYLFATQEHRAYFDDNVVALAQPAKEFELMSEGTFVRTSPPPGPATGVVPQQPSAAPAGVEPGWTKPQTGRDRVATVPTDTLGAPLSR